MKYAHPVIPFVPSLDERTEALFRMIQIKAGQKSMDLGAGDGRIMIEMAKRGVRAYGIELQRKYVRKAMLNIALARLEHMATIKEGDFWSEDLSGYDIITIYGMEIIMNDLEKKLSKELKPGAIVASNGFPIPGWKIWKEEDHVFVYVVTKS